MTLEFLHIADVHLGYQQYGNKDRFNDFGRAFHKGVEYAIERKVDVVLICGDLFHKATVDPPTLLQAIYGLDLLRDAGIPVVAIHGNHDKPRYRDHISWLDFLCEQRYLILLAPHFSGEGMQLLPWDGKRGGYLDINGVRFAGLPYLGASTQTILKELPAVLSKQPRDGIEFTVLMGHFGLEGEIPGMPGGISHNWVNDLKFNVDYLALGHWHKPYEREGWIYNPGSLETCSMNERKWAGGYYHVTVNSISEPKHTVRHVKGKRRPFHRLEFQVDEYTHPEALYDGLRGMLERENAIMKFSEIDPVVEVSLEGILAFDRSGLDMEYVNKIIEETISPLIARPKNNTRGTEFEISPDEQLPRKELERQILQDLIRRDSRYRDQASFWSNLMVEVKTMTLQGSPPKKIISAMQTRIRALDEEAVEE